MLATQRKEKPSGPTSRCPRICGSGYCAVYAPLRPGPKRASGSGMTSRRRWLRGTKRREFIALLGGAAAARPVVVRAQEPGRVYRLGAMIPAGRQTPAVLAFFDEMRLFGFIENQNLIVLANGFGVRNDELVERAEALIKAAPDVIISGPDNYTRVLQQLTRTIPLVAMTEDMLRA